MEIVLTLIVIVIIFFIFIKKGTGGKSFYQHKRDLNDHIASNGGMIKMFQKFVDYLRDLGFKVDKVGKDHMDLKYISDNLILEVQVIQVNFDNTNISIQKRRDGISSSAGLRIHSYDDLGNVALELLEQSLSEEEMIMENFIIKKEVKNNPKNDNTDKESKQVNLNSKSTQESKDLVTVEKADKYVSAGNYEKAYDIYSELFTNNPVDVSIILRMADCDRKMSNYESAINLCNMAIAVGSSDPLIYVIRGATYLEQNKPQEALKDFKIGIELGSETCKEFYQKLKKNIKKKDEYMVDENANSSNPLIIKMIYHIPLTSDTCISFKQKINIEWITATYTDSASYLKKLIPAISSEIENAKMATEDPVELNISDPTFMIGSRECKGRIRVYETHQTDLSQHMDLESWAKQSNDEKYLVKNGKLIFRNTKIVIEGIDKEYHSENIFIEPDGFVEDPNSDAEHVYKNKLYIGEQEVKKN